MNQESKYKVSIIVPVYNAAKYLDKCVNSLVSQTYSNLEILLVDDGSVDDSGSMCDHFAKEYSLVRSLHKENGGLVSAWKYGVEHSTGEYLSFVDSDDWVDSRMVADMAERLTGGECEIISSDYVIERDDGTSEPVYQRLAPGAYDREALLKNVLPFVLGQEHRYVTISRCMKLISRELVINNMRYCDTSIRMGEDTTIMLPCLLDCERLVIMDHKTYYHYLYVKESMIHKYDKGLYENNRKLRGIIDHILEDKCGTHFNDDKCCDTIKDKIAVDIDSDVKPMPDYAWMKLQADKEYIFLLLLALKNEARGNPSGYKKEILKICNDPEVRELVHRTSIEVHEKSNMLLYLVLLHPNAFMIWALRMAMICYDTRV